MKRRAPEASDAPTQQIQLRELPEDLWWFAIVGPFLRLKDISILRRASTFFNKHWLRTFHKNELPITVPQDASDLKTAVKIAHTFSKRRHYSAEDTVRIILSAGVHEITTGYCKRVTLACDHVTIAGQGANETFVIGGCVVENKRNICFKHLTFSNPEQSGLVVKGGRSLVSVLDCCFKQCATRGLEVYAGNTVHVARCEFVNNGDSGVYVAGGDVAEFDRHRAGAMLNVLRLEDCAMHHNNFGLNVDHSIVCGVRLGLSTSTRTRFR